MSNIKNRVTIAQPLSPNRLYQNDTYTHTHTHVICMCVCIETPWKDDLLWYYYFFKKKVSRGLVLFFYFKWYVKTWIPENFKIFNFQQIIMSYIVIDPLCHIIYPRKNHHNQDLNNEHPPIDLVYVIPECYSISFYTRCSYDHMNSSDDHIQMIIWTSL